VVRGGNSGLPRSARNDGSGIFHSTAKNSLTAILFFFIGLSSCNLHPQQREIINGNLQSGDTVFLVNEYIYDSTTQYIVYVEPDTSSKYYGRISDFSLNEEHYYVYIKADSNYMNIKYRYYYYSLDDKKDDLKEVSVILKKKNIPQNLPTKWIPLYLYNNEYYLYAPCEWIISIYNITDTLLIFYGWNDGDFGFPYDTIIQKSNNHYAIQDIKGFHNKEINIYIIDKEKGIAVFDFDYYEPCLYIDAEKIRNFPIIVCECTEKYEEYEFPKMDLKKLIKNK
jgi:hypothetical protein